MSLNTEKWIARLKLAMVPAGMGSGLWPIELLIIAYAMLTLGFAIPVWQKMADPWELVSHRAFIFAAMFLMWGLYRLWPTRLMAFVRISTQMSMLNLWYPEAYAFSSIRGNFDYVFARWDAVLFGCQPSLEFSRLCPWGWFSEAVNMGYFSYYPMILFVMIFFAFCRYEKYERASFVVMCSFFIFYMIYIFLPVAGPQFYFPAVGVGQIEAGCFPALGTYFATHTDILVAPGYSDGFFYGLVRWAQDSGEFPTAAFPSSHIGVSLILLYLVFAQSRRFFCLLMPFVVLLSLATVYIQAHYLVDAIAGVVFSVLIFYLSGWFYDIFFGGRSIPVE